MARVLRARTFPKPRTGVSFDDAQGLRKGRQAWPPALARGHPGRAPLAWCRCWRKGAHKLQPHRTHLLKACPALQAPLVHR